jgi:hypothetical protein
MIAGQFQNVFIIYTSRWLPENVKHYISKQGFRDGLEGFLLSVLSAIAVMVKYVKLRYMNKKKEINSDGQKDSIKNR